MDNGEDIVKFVVAMTIGLVVVVVFAMGLATYKDTMILECRKMAMEKSMTAIDIMAVCK